MEKVTALSHVPETAGYRASEVWMRRGNVVNTEFSENFGSEMINSSAVGWHYESFGIRRKIGGPLISGTALKLSDGAQNGMRSA
jgi:hypothetical protein